MDIPGKANKDLLPYFAFPKFLDYSPNNIFSRMVLIISSPFLYVNICTKNLKTNGWTDLVKFSGQHAHLI